MCLLKEDAMKMAGVQSVIFTIAAIIVMVMALIPPYITAHARQKYVTTRRACEATCTTEDRKPCSIQYAIGPGLAECTDLCTKKCGG